MKAGDPLVASQSRQYWRTVDGDPCKAMFKYAAQLSLKPLAWKALVSLHICLLCPHNCLKACGRRAGLAFVVLMCFCRVTLGKTVTVLLL